MPVAESSISVIVPVYNGEPYLAEALDSVLGQSRR
ncbi:MAG TPA: glycosyltransferase, partial [bacterium]|nr:glycosyltransferase [bacterium]